jgi:tRNA U34 5-carboxymethylaminomethyl modifying enzyme MnmG/GidA
MGLVPYAQIIFLFRLSPARNAGVVSDARWAAFQATKGTIREATHLMKRTSFSPQVREAVRHAGQRGTDARLCARAGKP